MPHKSQFCLDLKMSENKVLFKLKNEGTFFSYIFGSGQNRVSCSIFVETRGAHTLLGTVIWLFIPASVHLLCTWPAACTVQLINTGCQTGLSRGFVDYSENGGQIDTQIHR